MVTGKDKQVSLPAYFSAVQIMGVLIFGIGAATLFSKIRPVILGAAPWLGMSWAAWSFFVLGILVVIANGARLIIYAQRIKQRAAS